MYLWDRKYPNCRWDASDDERFREQVDRFLYGGEEQFTMNACNHGAGIILRDKILECSQGFSESVVYGCHPKGMRFMGCRIMVNGVFHWVEKVSKDKKQIHLEIAPTVNPLAVYSVVGRNTDMYNANTTSKSALDKPSLLKSKSVDDWDVTMLF